MYEVLLQDFAKNNNNLFYNVMLGNFFIVERNGGSLLMMMPYSAIGSLQLEVGENIEGEIKASIRVSSNDDRYQRRGIAQSVFINTNTAKADYEVFCKQVLERNPNVYINY